MAKPNVVPVRRSMIRVNPRRLEYIIEDIGENLSRIQLKGTEKFITVDIDFESINRQWYKWFMQRAYVQDAFSNFSADEREFIMTGITKDEWDETFKDIEE